MSESEDPLIGAKIGQYTLQGVLGQGAMGTVYLARHNEKKHEVAIKFLAGEFATKPEFVQRFVNEAAASASLEHENIIKVYEAGQEEGVHYMVMEFVDGVNLAHFLKIQDHVKEAQVRPWLRLAAEALKYAHSRGIVHRDLKPENIMLTKKGGIKIADLGLSKNLDADENFSVTMSGTVIGTPYYISPEQIRNAKHVDSRTDMYSLGATFYHLVVGVPPFQGDSAAEVMSRHMNDPLPNPQRKIPSLSDGFCHILTHMMEKEPSKRYQTMDELIVALDALEKGKNVTQKLQVRKEGRTESQIIRRRQAIAKNLGGVALTAGLLGIVFLLFTLIKSHIFTESKGSKSHVSPSQTVATTTKSTTATSTTPPTPTRSTSTSTPTQPPPPVSSSSPSTVTAPETTKTVSTSPEAESTTTIIAEEKSRTEEEESTMKIGPNTDLNPLTAPQAAAKKYLYNWVDLMAILLIGLGIPLARHLGFVWSALRALSVWIAVVVICRWFEPITNWFHQDLSFPSGTSAVFGFSIMSAVMLFPAWTITQKLRGHQKETWQLKLDHTLALAPSFIMGMAVATWILAFLAITVPDSMPIGNSWVGTKLYDNFPSISRASQMFNDEKKK